MAEPRSALQIVFPRVFSGPVALASLLMTFGWRGETTEKGACERERERVGPIPADVTGQAS